MLYDLVENKLPNTIIYFIHPIWEILSKTYVTEEDLYNLVSLCTQIFKKDGLLFLINSYTTGLSKTVLENILLKTVNQKSAGFISSDELGIKSSISFFAYI